MAFTKIRPFIVLREMQHCCLCLPLNTYGHQGTEKDRIRAGDYAAVYTMGSKPNVGTAERMSKKPFPIIIEDPRERIDPRSRLNFGQVYTIQHNLKVLKIGRIPDEYLPILNSYFIQAIAGTPAQDTANTSVAFKSLTLGSDDHTSFRENKDEALVDKEKLNPSKLTKILLASEILIEIAFKIYTSKHFTPGRVSLLRGVKPGF
jgi:hypothetical protein